MDSQRWTEAKRVFDRALAYEGEDRERFVEEACHGDAELKCLVSSVLAGDEDWEHAPFPAQPTAQTPGCSIGPYRILRRIGTGGMGVVYLAEQEQPIHRRVAIKLVQPGMDTEEVLTRFRTELRTLSAMDHPNIARVLDAGKIEDGRPYFVMEYVPGVPLNRHCDDHKLSVDERLDLFLQICHATYHAHKKGIIHRDLKPSNVLVRMIDDDAQIKIIDFGIAKAMGSALHADVRATTTAAGQVLGTPCYMSPEQAEKTSQDLDTRSDIYSLGVMLYELLVGVLPFDFDAEGVQDPAGVQRLLEQKTPPKPSTRLSELGGGGIKVADHRQTAVRSLVHLVRGDLDWVVLKALEWDRRRRYQTVSELAAEIESFRHGEAVSAGPPSAIYRLKKLVRRHRVAAALLLLVAVIPVALLRDSSTHAAHQRVTMAVLPLVNGSDDPEQEFFSDGLTEELIALLGGIAPGQLSVIARSTIMHYKGTEKTISQIGPELGVDYILEGSVRRGEGVLRILIQLVQVSDQTQLWSASYVRDPQQVMATQQEVAQRVASSLAVEMLPSTAVAREDAVNPKVFDEYLKGRHLRDTVTEDGFRASITHFQNAIDLEPDFASAYSAMASCYCLLSGHAFEVDRPELLMLTAKDLAEKALALNPDLAEAHGVLGMAKLKYDWDWIGAERDLRRAIDLNPSYPLARIWYGFSLSSQGRHDEAIAQLRIARDLDPVSRATNLNLAWQHYEARQYDEAIQIFDATLNLFPGSWPAYWGRGLAYCEKGMDEEALADLRLARQMSGSHSSVLGSLGYAHAILDQRAQAEQFLRILLARSNEGYVPPTTVAGIYAALGDLDNAFAWLDKAIQVRSRSVVWLAVAHEFDPLRNDRRYDNALRRVGLIH